MTGEAADEARPMSKADFPVYEAGLLAEIRARDAEQVRCLTCGGYPGGAHDSTVEECEANLKAEAEASGRDWHERQYKFIPEDTSEHMRDKMAELGPEMLCWTKRDHHPFVDDPELTTEYDDAVKDRRALLRMIDRWASEG